MDRRIARNRANRTARALASGALALGFGGFGCGSSEDSPEMTAAEIEAEAREAVASAVDYADEKRRALVEQARRATADADGELDRAREALADVPAETRDRLEDAIDRAAEARDALRAQIEELQASGAAQWETASERLTNALAEMAEARREVSAALRGDESATDAS